MLTKRSPVLVLLFFVILFELSHRCKCKFNYEMINAMVKHQDLSEIDCVSPEVLCLWMISFVLLVLHYWAFYVNQNLFNNTSPHSHSPLLKNYFELYRRSDRISSEFTRYNSWTELILLCHFSPKSKFVRFSGLKFWRFAY